MVEKNKNYSNKNSIKHIVSAIGVTAMLAATVCSLVEHMDKEGQRLITALQPVYTSTGQSLSADTLNDDQFRRAGKEEIHHSSATYGAVKRSASVAGAV